SSSKRRASLRSPSSVASLLAGSWWKSTRCFARADWGHSSNIVGVEDHDVGVPEEVRERLGLGAVLELVLGIGRVDHRLAFVLEAEAVGIAAVQLQVRR